MFDKKLSPNLSELLQSFESIAAPNNLVKQSLYFQTLNSDWLLNKSETANQRCDIWHDLERTSLRIDLWEGVANCMQTCLFVFVNVVTI